MHPSPTPLPQLRPCVIYQNDLTLNHTCVCANARINPYREKYIFKINVYILLMSQKVGGFIYCFGSLKSSISKIRQARVQRSVRSITSSLYTDHVGVHFWLLRRLVSSFMFTYFRFG